MNPLNIENKSKEMKVILKVFRKIEIMRTAPVFETSEYKDSKTYRKVLT